MAAKTQYGPWGVPLQRYGSFAGKAGSASLFTNVRVEAQQFRSAIIRWDYSGVANPVSLYRSTDGSSYTLLDATIDPDDGEYLDEGLDDGTLYYYKLSDDSGSTFSSAVFVVTYVTLVGQVVNQASFNLRDHLGLEGIAPLAAKMEARARSDDSQNPCILCSHNQALVVRCSDECTAYRVILTEDINSISFIGCDEFDCPRIEFITPPGETYGVCGWPVSCNFIGDECHDAPTDGGTLGSSDWSDGIKFPAPGEGDNKLDPGCPCPRTGGLLSIRCCSESCDLTCGEGSSARIKACGGVRPYSWTATGDVRLSSETKDAITVTRNSSGANGYPGVTAYMDIGGKAHRIDGDCGSDATTNTVESGAYVEYDCLQASLGCEGCFGTNPPSGATATYTIRGTECVLGEEGGSYEASSSNTPLFHNTAYEGTANQFQVQLVWPARSLNHTTGFMTSPNNISAVNTIISSMVDVRTPEMSGSGLCAGPCDEEAVTVTVTDALGRNATVILTT